MDPAAPNPNPGRTKDPNFLAVVAAAIVIALLFFIGSWLVVRHDGRHLLPSTHPDHEPHSYLRQPASGIRTPQLG
ncbi:MAG: hypothetical protein ACLGXA_01630 [Acidobacteriota bacterium]